MKKQHTTILTASLAGILLIGSLAAAGCGNSGSAATDDLTKVTLNEVAHSIFYAPQYVAIENGYFADYVVNCAQLTQRAGNFLVARQPMADFEWVDLKSKDILGGRKGGVHISM